MKSFYIVVLINLLFPLCTFAQGNYVVSRQLYDSLENVRPRRIMEHKIKGKTVIVSVKTQKQFEDVNDKITSAINCGADYIKVKLARGIYYYRDRHIDRFNEDYPNVSISIVGNNAVLIGAGKKYNDGDDYREQFAPVTTFVDAKTLKTYMPWGEVHSADGLVDVIDESSHLCKLPYKSIRDYSKEECIDAYICLTEWYMSYTYKVSHVKDGWIYFTADNLAQSSEFERKGFNVNYDYIYAGVNPRFRLCNITTDDDSKQVSVIGGKVSTNHGIIHECRATNFISLYHNRYRSFVVSGLRFVGNTKGSSLIGLSDVNTDWLTISDCRFEDINSAIVFAFKTKNFVFSNNKVINNSTNCVIAKNDCENVQIVNNHFEKSGWAMTFQFCVWCECKDFYVANNTFKDFSYGAILAGMMRGEEKKYECSGIIENNEIYLSDEYFNNREKFTMMDAGAIQLRTQSDNTIVRHNYVHDYTGMRSNRGIFCDEGAHNFSIYGNVVINTPNSYSIDARRVDGNKRADALNNRNNLMMYNVVDNDIRFVGSLDNNNNCRKGANILLKKNDNKEPKCQYGSLVWSEDDIQLVYRKVSKGKIIVGKDALKELKASSLYPAVRKRFKRQIGNK